MRVSQNFSFLGVGGKKSDCTVSVQHCQMTGNSLCPGVWSRYIAGHLFDPSSAGTLPVKTDRGPDGSHGKKTYLKTEPQSLKQSCQQALPFWDPIRNKHKAVLDVVPKTYID